MNNSDGGEPYKDCKTGPAIGVRERSANETRRDELGTDYRVCNLKQLWVTLFAATLIT
jgi:hypothetical protein